MRDHSISDNDDVVLGDDFVAPENTVEEEVRIRRARRSFLRNGSGGSLTRKIITFNLIALNVLVAGILYLNSSRDGLAQTRADSLLGDVELIADVFEAKLPAPEISLLTSSGDANAQDTLAQLDIQQGMEVFVYDTQQNLLASIAGSMPRPNRITDLDHPTVITDAIDSGWAFVSKPFEFLLNPDAPETIEDQARLIVGPSLEAGVQTIQGEVDGTTVYIVATPVMQGERAVGAVALASASGEIEKLLKVERERVLQMFIVATLVSVALSLILASTISNPLAELAAAAEVGGARNRSKGQDGGRIRIPDLTARPDEIGRLSGALRGMVGALYNRIDGNEQFAADVAHEIKNPLASLRSAVGTMRVAKRDDQREKLLEVIEHDVRRLDRLVSDISNASRLDSELVKEDQEFFDLVGMLDNLARYLGEEADKKGIEFITDFPPDPIEVTGLEGRLAQVFVNLISNAISFCEEGDAIRVWTRKRENRVVVVVEDTGPGIPEQALTKIFQRFYSERAENDFGNNSGLGLSISKQIVEAHDGVIWAENIRPTDSDITSDPLGARFVVGLPV
ncbi:sensor histidine kinase [Roseovarius rhodophyticola]|uniref:histidine kinase n=1 Tax=Roseovarius rhodophyticola TaxID=3080827 RepID=A0ABZ2TB85_9RHOB|nr:sensor histidine kinase [Roseovarius sp. W115]MDV2930631.1 sensor histidine kinase [Roseovarius sp. W115]